MTTNDNNGHDKLEKTKPRSPEPRPCIRNAFGERQRPSHAFGRYWYSASQVHIAFLFAVVCVCVTACILLLGRRRFFSLSLNFPLRSCSLGLLVRVA